MKTNVLLSVSDANVGVVLSEYLRLRGFDVEYAPTASEAFNAAAKRQFDFCVLGISDAKELTQLVSDIRRVSEVPLFVLQNTFDKDAQLALYEAGADDCLLQPVLPDLLICKMDALLRRQARYEKTLPQVFDFPSFHFDSVTQTLQVGNQTYHLSGKENSVLLLLCRHRNESVGRSRILKTVWQSDSYFKSRSLSVYINRLRHYIEPDSPVRIVSLPTQGYKLLTP